MTISQDWQDEEQKNKASPEAKFRHFVRNDLNALITKATKQNELIEQLIKKVDILSSNVMRGNK